MIKASEIIAATNAAVNDFDFTGVTTDSRAVQPGELFVALVGDKFDGHDYCAKAVELGARGVVISHDIVPMSDNVAVFRVENTLTAYQEIARAYRRKFAGLKVLPLLVPTAKPLLRTFWRPA